MTTAITRQPAKSFVNCEVSYVQREGIDFLRTARQYEGYCQALKQMGVTVESLPPVDRYPDSVFIEDNAIILDELAVMTSMGAGSRHGEPALLVPVLSKYRRLVKISLPATIEGGDVVQIGKALYVGLSARTNHAGIEALRALVEPLGYAVHPIEVRGCLHLKTACTPLDDETLLVNPYWINVEALGSLRLLPVPTNEPFGATVMRLQKGILANVSYPLTLEMIDAHGYQVTSVDMSEFSKAEAGVTCLSLLIDDGHEQEDQAA